MTTVAARTKGCGDAAILLFQQAWRGQRLRQLKITPQTPGLLAGGLFRSSSGASSTHDRKHAADPRRRDGPSHSAYGQTDGYQAATSAHCLTAARTASDQVTTPTSLRCFHFTNTTSCSRRLSPKQSPPKEKLAPNCENSTQIRRTIMASKQYTILPGLNLSARALF